MGMTQTCSWQAVTAARSGRWRLSLPLVVCLASLASMGMGCSNQPYDVAPVSGHITLDGKPLANAQVIYQPIAGSDKNAEPGSGSFGKTDADGRYTLETVEPAEPGAVVGRHRVTISTANFSANPADDSAAAMPKEILPKICSNGKLQMEVPAGGTDKADFDIKSR